MPITWIKRRKCVRQQFFKKDSKKNAKKHMGRVHVRSLAEMTEKNESEKKKEKRMKESSNISPQKLKILISLEDQKI